MKNIFLTTTEGILRTKDGEELSFRVYSDGWVKIEGLNTRQDFKTIKAAFEYTQSQKIA